MKSKSPEEKRRICLHFLKLKEKNPGSPLGHITPDGPANADMIAGRRNHGEGVYSSGKEEHRRRRTWRKHRRSIS